MDKSVPGGRNSRDEGSVGKRAILREQNKEGAWGRLEMGRQEWAVPS